MKKIITIFAVVALLLTALPLTALAHGRYNAGANNRETGRYPLCSANNCQIAGPHQHENFWYRSQNSSGQSYGSHGHSRGHHR